MAVIVNCPPSDTVTIGELATAMGVLFAGGVMLTGPEFEGLEPPPPQALSIKVLTRQDIARHDLKPMNYPPNINPFKL